MTQQPDFTRIATDCEAELGKIVIMGKYGGLGQQLGEYFIAQWREAEATAELVEPANNCECGECAVRRKGRAALLKLAEILGVPHG